MPAPAHCDICGARLRDSYADLCPACRADARTAGVRQDKRALVLKRLILTLTGVVVLMVIPRLLGIWPGK